MIPTIETIVEDLAAGAITKQQAIAWLNMHADGAADKLRHHFAGLAMQGILASGDAIGARDIAAFAYTQAYAMLKQGSNV